MKFSSTKFFVNAPLCAVLLLLASCSKEQPRTTAEFVDNPRLLEATMVRCSANRAELKYTAECANAREAVDRLAVREEEAKRSQLEAESIRKREALRRARQAAEESQLRAEELERLRREAEYLGQFDEVPAAEQRNEPVTNQAPITNDVAPPPANATTPVPDEAPPASAMPDADATLEEVREELRRRQQPPSN
jgi:hypothetical protein